jgi:hypothetical protein
MKTFKAYFSIVAITLFLACGCRSLKNDQQMSLSQTAIWQPRPLIIDGSDGDWIKPLPYSDRKEKLNYAVSNDMDNIYLMLSTKDQKEQQKILQGGLTVWINGQGEKTEYSSVGIAFPTNGRNNHDRNIMAAARPDLYKDKITSLDDLKDYSLYGFKNDTVGNYDYGQSNEEGVEVKISYNNVGELVYEALVPFRAVFPRNSRVYFGKTIAVGFFFEGIPPSPNNRNKGGGGGVSIGGGVGMGSFGGGGGMGISIGTGSLGGVGGRGEQRMYELSKIWREISLARPSAKSGANNLNK